jgi:tetrahydromethanopterin S-methyltransferase subunit G
VKRLQILLNRTREEVARDYVTRADMHTDMNRVISRLDNLDKKIDELMRSLSR